MTESSDGDEPAVPGADVDVAEAVPVRTFPPTMEDQVVIGVREIVRFTGRKSRGFRATTGAMLRLLD